MSVKYMCKDLSSGKRLLREPDSQIRYVIEDRLSNDVSVWQDAAIFLKVLPNVVYELKMLLLFGNIAGRRGILRLTGADYIYKPVITGNINGLNDNIIIMRDTVNSKPDSISSGEQYEFQLTGYQSSLIEARGIFKSNVPEPALRLEFRTDEDELPLILKQYSYLKLSR